MRPKGTLKIILEKPTKLESICFYGNSAFNTKGPTNTQQVSLQQHETCSFYPIM